MSSLEVYLVTFNCARRLIEPAAFGRYLLDAHPKDAALPGIIVLSLQEIAPIAYAFLGGAYVLPYFNRVVSSVNVAAERHGGGPDTYENLLTAHVGLTGIVVFARQEVAQRLRWIQTAGTGVGLWQMGNKGAVGVRMGYSLEERDGEELGITLVAAHLAPMENATERRNADWENIVRNLVFSPHRGVRKLHNGRRTLGDEAEDEDAEPLLSRDSDEDDKTPTGLYNPGSHAFLAGDLNYRSHSDGPEPESYVDYPQPAKIGSPKHFSNLLKHDQLGHERDAGRTVHGFHEAPINFPPTYKYSMKRSAGKPSAISPDTDSDAGEAEHWDWSKHRYPSWTDRILFLPPLASSSQLELHTYTALPLQPTSDHRPVALSVSVPLEALDKDDQDIRSRPPFPINPRWQAQRAAARRKEIIVGVLAYLSLTREGNAVLAGVAGGLLAGWFVFKAILEW
ncbi:hypothetical protein W97_04951 [Coniosporium apollinis CBS 100218]|uniref:Inositol polyphosphate-related phosphatase domain-containing protein n=1 Tax=Coniosporium apollinis (strain CBS 100218) TaxID=1168221 RepID=R7YUX6_CONA1|nr:uncharacterized protein W97_04951 [Coniosporium apollinis CBS 100218]EON65712.1 hypothetical protein W97_04951 [Coniosporium apollinis CBS 100218]